MIPRSKHVCMLTAVVALPWLTGCHLGDSGENGIAICEQSLRLDDQERHLLGAGCGFYGGHGSTTFTSDLAAAPDLKVVGIVSRIGFQVTATSRGITVATGALSEQQLESGEKLILPVTTLGGDAYEFRYWGSWTIDPAQYLDGLDAGLTDGGFN